MLFRSNDLVSYNEKHNQANGEDNRDGEDHNRSWNCGEEGPTTNPDVIRLRERQKRNFLATLFLSQGIPMLLGGDEMARTQHGNNNAYCQDNEISWFNWDDADEDLLEFTRKLIRFRRDHPVFMRRGWFIGKAVHGKGIEDIGWFTPDGHEMEEEHWGEGFAKSMAVFLNGKAIGSLDPFGQPIQDDSFLVLFNAGQDEILFNPPVPPQRKIRWEKILDTGAGGFLEEPVVIQKMDRIPVQDRSLAVLRCCELEG